MRESNAGLAGQGGGGGGGGSKKSSAGKPEMKGLPFPRDGLLR